MLSSNIRLNQQALFSSTISLKISDAQIKKHLRDPRVRQLKDERCSLYLKFNKARTGGTWVLMEYKNGSQFGHRIGKYPATQAKHIMELVSITSLKMARGEETGGDTFRFTSDLLDWYLEREQRNRTVKAARLANVKSMIEKHLVPAFLEVPVQRVDHDLIDKKLIQPVLDAGYSVSYLSAMFTVFKSAYTNARRLKKIGSNPMAELNFCDFIHKPRTVKGCRLSVDAVQGVLQGLDEQKPPVRMLIMMMLCHGSRVGETRKARWSNISLIRKQWFIPKEDTKADREVTYPLTDHMVELLRSYRAWQTGLGYEGDCLFPVSRWTNKPAYSGMASEWVRKVSQRAWSAHDLRKIARTIWADLGIDYLVSEMLLNHAKGKLDKAYIHTPIELQKQQALQTYHEWLKNCWLSCFRPIPTDR